MKGEQSFPDLDSDKVRMTSNQRSEKKKVFNQHNSDKLHNCGDCQDDFKGKPPTQRPTPFCHTIFSQVLTAGDATLK